MWPLSSAVPYYVSAAGNDSADGLSPATAWKTLTRASQMRYVPGASILLRAGDTWARDTLSLQGSGTFDSATYESTFSSSYASALSAYLAGTAYSDMHAILISDGASTADADDRANAYCQRLAFRDAVPVARDAADSSSTWITVGKYSTGANPVIAPAQAQQVAISIDRASTGGWKIQNVNINGGLIAGIHQYPTFGTSANGLWIEGCTITGVTGMGPESPPYPYVHIFSSGIATTMVNYVFIVGGEINACDSPAWVSGAHVTMVDAANWHHSVLDHPMFLWCQPIWSGQTPGVRLTDLLIRNTTIDHMCTTGYKQGAAGLFLGAVTRVVIYNSTISNTIRNTNIPDGIGIDFEYNCIDVALLSSNVHDNANAVFLMFQNPVAVVLPPTGYGNLDSGTIVADNTFSNNGTFNPTGFPALVRATGTSQDKIVWARNTITRAAPTQKLFSDANQIPGNLTDTPQATWFFGADNVVT